ncbi:hypothetical protein Dimus_003232 [Dionaea muscipula]
MDSMMGAANHATIIALRNIPLKHKCAILCGNMTETSLLTGDVLYAAVRTDERRCRKIDRLMEEISCFQGWFLFAFASNLYFACLFQKYALEREVKDLKFECDTAFEISTQIKADVDMVMEENQTLENENRELKTVFEGEKNKKQTLEDKVKELQMALEREKDRQSNKNNELVASYSKYHELLRKKMNLDTSLNERKRESEKLQMALTQMELNPKVKYEKEPIPSIEGETSVRPEAYEADPMNFINVGP